MTAHTAESRSSISRVTRFVVEAEPWLPLAIGAAWWLAMYPGLFGEDSLIALTEARSGPITVWFTAWWILIIQAVTMGTRIIPAVTLAGVLLLTWAVRQWAMACLPAGPARAWAVVILCASPLVGALGIQARHDAWMTAGLLLCAAVVARTGFIRERMHGSDYAQLVVAVLLLATRHNGLPTLVLAAIASVVAFRRNGVRIAVTLLVMAAAVGVVTEAATRSAGQTRSVDPAQAVEWLMADVSCLVSHDGIEVGAGEWSALEAVADRVDWPQPKACRFVNPLFIAPSFRIEQVGPHIPELISAWFSLFRHYPLQLVGVHLRRVSLFLPPFITGAPDLDFTPFIHSTILPNDFGLEWAVPQVAQITRLPVRAWNAMRVLLANTSVWLAALALVAWKRPSLRATLVPAIVIGVALEAGLLATAPISEGRYGLFILICGQLSATYWWLESRTNDSATSL